MVFGDCEIVGLDLNIKVYAAWRCILIDANAALDSSLVCDVEETRSPTCPSGWRPWIRPRRVSRPDPVSFTVVNIRVAGGSIRLLPVETVSSMTQTN